MSQSAYNERTRELLIKQYRSYPNMKEEDVFKYIFQSSFGCEHLVSDEDAAIKYIIREYETLHETRMPVVEALDGEYSRINLSCLTEGLKPETLAKLFLLSGKKEQNGKYLLEQKLQVAKELVEEGKLPFDSNDFNKSIDKWRAEGYPAIHHSDDFRVEYHPAYRVVDNRYADFLPVFAEIDKHSCQGCLIVAIEGGSASGKTTLANLLHQVYDCTVFHMDDFFLRPEQRTPERLAEIGGNVDRERFLEEVIKPCSEGNNVLYRRFDCNTQSLCEPIVITPDKLTVVEGVYSMHPILASYYNISVFLDIDSAYQSERINKRNTPQIAKRFFDEWIPLELKYFTGMNIKEKCNISVPIKKYE